MPLVDVEIAASNRCQEAGLSLDEAPPRDEQDLHRLANETTVLVTGISGRVIGYFSVFPLAYLHLELPAVDRAWLGRGAGCRLAEAYLKAAIPMIEYGHDS